MRIDKTSSDGLRLAVRLWVGIDAPARFNDEETMRAWSKPMESLLRQSGYTYRQFRMFLIWATRLKDKDGANYGNTFSAEYLRAARDPMATLVKQFDSLFRTYFLPRADKLISILED